MKTETNPKSEIRNPKEIRIPKPETSLHAAWENSPTSVGQLFRHSGFGLLSDFGIRVSEFNIP
jgi:hypothetical protein